MKTRQTMPRGRDRSTDVFCKRCGQKIMTIEPGRVIAQRGAQRTPVRCACKSRSRTISTDADDVNDSN